MPVFHTSYEYHSSSKTHRFSNRPVSKQFPKEKGQPSTDGMEQPFIACISSRQRSLLRHKKHRVTTKNVLLHFISRRRMAPHLASRSYAESFKCKAGGFKGEAENKISDNYGSKTWRWGKFFRFFFPFSRDGAADREPEGKDIPAAKNLRPGQMRTLRAKCSGKSPRPVPPNFPVSYWFAIYRGLVRLRCGKEVRLVIRFSDLFNFFLRPPLVTPRKKIFLYMYTRADQKFPTLYIFSFK